MVTKILQLVCLLLQGHFLFSQCINVELSVTWEEGSDIFQKDSLVDIPKLNITYSNICDVNYYFFKVSPRSDGRPMVMCQAMVQYEDNDYLKRVKSHGNYANQNFNVLIGGEPWYDTGWKISRDTTNYHRKRSLEYVECYLEEIYQYLYPDHLDKAIEKYLNFVPNVAPENIISGSIKNLFVFLKPGETYIETYNLIGFKLVEGCFTFVIDQDRIEDYIIFSPHDTLKLPAIIGEYQLYSGSFNTNKVTVCFGER